jgi:hypothetical protein
MVHFCEAHQVLPFPVAEKAAEGCLEVIASAGSRRLQQWLHSLFLLHCPYLRHLLPAVRHVLLDDYHHASPTDLEHGEVEFVVSDRTIHESAHTSLAKNFSASSQHCAPD